MCQPCRRLKREAGVQPRDAHCAHCAKPFESTWTGKQWRKSCSDDCRSAIARAAIRPQRLRDPRDERVPLNSQRWRDCEICPKQYIATDPGQRTCGRACGLRLKRQTTRVYSCKRCRKAFDCFGVVGAPPRRCPGCRPKRKPKTHLDRARHYGRQYEPISPIRVFERDGWTCGICSRRIPKGKKVPDPLAATLDHIIPMSKPGGDHLYANVRAAHFSCNSKRGNRGAAQLLLVG